MHNEQFSADASFIAAGVNLEAAKLAKLAADKQASMRGTVGTSRSGELIGTDDEMRVYELSREMAAAALTIRDAAAQIEILARQIIEPPEIRAARLTAEHAAQ
ncbi:MAG TPA: hypothetical protein VHU61_08510 [Solirubrobacteraceae bacterium]|jgi:hypothetical protein|nr:hypothetical protein [Solirubrobacteraceae bacterium]